SAQDAVTAHLGTAVVVAAVAVGSRAVEDVFVVVAILTRLDAAVPAAQGRMDVVDPRVDRELQVISLFIVSGRAGRAVVRELVLHLSQAALRGVRAAVELRLHLRDASVEERVAIVGLGLPRVLGIATEEALQLPGDALLLAGVALAETLRRRRRARTGPISRAAGAWRTRRGALRVLRVDRRSHLLGERVRLTRQVGGIVQRDTRRGGVLRVQLGDASRQGRLEAALHLGETGRQCVRHGEWLPRVLGVATHQSGRELGQALVLPTLALRFEQVGARSGRGSYHQQRAAEQRDDSISSHVVLL